MHFRSTIRFVREGSAHDRSTSRRIRVERAVGRVLAVALLAVGPVTLFAVPASAQEIALSVNGDPVTSIDIDERMRILKAMHKPASREAAIESMIESRLKDREAVRFGIVIKDDELGEEANILAKKLKTSSQQLMQDFAKAGATPAAVKTFLRGELGYFVLVRALNRGVEASEVAVRQELAKEKGKGGITTYTIRQVVMTLSPGASPEQVQSAAKEAEALRAKFTSCESGIPYAKSLPGVAVREKMTRSATQLNESIKDVFDKMPIGHLTNPSRSPNGLELIALCDRSVEKNDEELRKIVAERILNQHMTEVADAKYKELRRSAVIARP